MNAQEARVILLEYALEESRNTIEFLHGCLTDHRYSYGHPEQTANRLADIEQLIGPSEGYCHHSVHRQGCEDCEKALAQRQRVYEAREVIARQPEVVA